MKDEEGTSTCSPTSSPHATSARPSTSPLSRTVCPAAATLINSHCTDVRGGTEACMTGRRKARSVPRACTQRPVGGLHVLLTTGTSTPGLPASGTCGTTATSTSSIRRGPTKIEAEPAPFTARTSTAPTPAKSEAGIVSCSAPAAKRMESLPAASHTGAGKPTASQAACTPYTRATSTWATPLMSSRGTGRVRSTDPPAGTATACTSTASPHEAETDKPGAAALSNTASAPTSAAASAFTK